MIRQTWAILVDSYRDLNARKMFWIALILSALIVAMFAMLGVNEQGLTLLTWTFPMPQANPHPIYRMVFSYLVIGIWLTWGATILALISTASIFPEFISGGSIELYLAKPISRLRLFLTKYVAGLLFALLQVTVVIVPAFFVIGVRGGEWRPSLFLAIPIVLVFFSYLFGLSVLIGVATRSTLAALLLTLLLWFVVFLIGVGETKLLELDQMQAPMARFYDLQIQATDARIERLQASTQPSDRQRLAEAERQRQGFVTAREGLASMGRFARAAHGIAYWVKTFVPKTTETINLLDRHLFTQAELVGEARSGDETAEAMRQAKETLVETERGRSLTWIVGTSLLFEAVTVALAAWIFWRRDY